MTEQAHISHSLRKLWLLLPRRERRLMAGLFAVMLGGSALEAASLGMIPLFVSTLGDPARVLGHSLLGDLLQQLGMTDARSIFLFGGAALLLVMAVKTAYLSGSYFLEAHFLRNQQVRLRTQLFAAYMHAPYLFHLRRNPAELMRNANEEVERVTNAVLAPLLGLALQALMALAIFTLLLVVQPIVTAIGVGLFAAASYLFLRVVRGRALEHGREAQRHRGELIKSVNHGLGGFKEAAVLGRQADFVGSYRQSAVRLARSAVHRQVTTKLAGPFLELVAVAGLLTIGLLLLATGGAVAELVPTLALFAAALVRLKQNVLGLVSAWNTLRYEHYTINPVYDDLRELQGVADGARGHAGQASERLAFIDRLQVRDLTYSYPGAAQPALRDIDLTIQRGESVALVGASGAGKSTLADILLGLLAPDKGVVSVDGADIRGHAGAWRANIGYIPQALYLLDDTLRRNVAFGLPDKTIDDARVWDALGVAQLQELIGGLPHGLDTFVGDRGVRLSGGQRQRVCIARALYADPSVLILDEATSALDNRTEKQIVDELERTRGERTLIVIAHRLSTVQNCHRLYFLQHGRIEAAGPYRELLETSPAFRRLANVRDPDGNGHPEVALGDIHRRVATSGG